MAGAAGRPASSERSFERLYRRHVEDVYRYALGVLANRSDAEDVTQTTFLNAYRSYRDGTLPAKPLNWLIAIAHNVCRQRFRSAARRPREVALDPRLSAASEDQVEGFRAEDIRRALSALTFTQRSALALRELEGRSYREIADVLELSESAVETLIFRARKAFREQLEGTMTCNEAELAISRQLDGVLGRSERVALRSHLRECEECSVVARRFRAQRSAFKRLVLIPLPQSLASFAGGGSSVAAGGAALGGGLGIKALVIGSAAIVAAGVTTGEVVTHTHGRAQPTRAAAPSVAEPVRAVRAVPAARVVPAVAASVRASRESEQRSATPASTRHVYRPHAGKPAHATAHRDMALAAAQASVISPGHSAARAAVKDSTPSLHGQKAASASSAPGLSRTRKKPKSVAHPKPQVTGKKASHPTPVGAHGVHSASRARGAPGQGHGNPAPGQTDPGPPPDVPASGTGPPADTPAASPDHPDSAGPKKDHT